MWLRIPAWPTWHHPHVMRGAWGMGLNIQLRLLMRCESSSPLYLAHQVLCICVFREHLWNCSKLIKIKTKLSLFITLLLWWSFKVLQFFTTPFISNTLTFGIPNWPTSHPFLLLSLHLTLDRFSPPLSLWASPWGDVLRDLPIHSFSLQLRASLYFTNLLSFYFWWFYSFSCNSICYLFKSSWTFLMVSYSRLNFFLYVLAVHLFYIQNQHSSVLMAWGT